MPHRALGTVPAVTDDQPPTWVSWLTAPSSYWELWHLRVPRDNGFAVVRADGTRRLYTVDAAPLQEVDVWRERLRAFWNQRRDALPTELARGNRERRRKGPAFSTDNEPNAGGGTDK
jgi:hypothetical protein